MLVELATLLAGLMVVAYSSGKTVEYSTHIAHALKVPPILIGLILVSAGTDIPEIANSIFSSYTGHGDINVGDTLGSCLSQISLVLGIVVLLAGMIKAHRKNILALGIGAIIAVAAATFVTLDGELTRSDALLLIGLYILLLVFCARFAEREIGVFKKIDLSGMKNKLPLTLFCLVLALAGVVIGAIVVVESAIDLSRGMGIPEYFVSFFIIGIGTSLPELSVEFAAARKKKYGLLIGDLMGSNITDATLALGIGPLLFPTSISSGIITPLATYVIIVSIIVVGLFAWRKKVDKPAALLILALYLLSYLFI
jgi:cation:H+ antiporter